MDSSAIGPVVLTEVKKAVLNEGIGLIFSRWTAMRAAVENGWGGRFSEAIYEHTASSVFDYFIRSKDPLDSDGLVEILEAGLTELNTLAEDGSVEEVIEELLDLYEDCLDGSFVTIENPRVTTSQTSASVVKASYDSDEENDDEDEEDTCMNNDQTTDMMVDGSEHCSNRKVEAMPVDEPAAMPVDESKL